MEIFQSYDHKCTATFLWFTVYTMSQKTVQNCFCQNFVKPSTDFDNFWQNGGNEAKIMRGALIFHLT